MTTDEKKLLHELAAGLCYEALVLDHLGQEALCQDDELAEQMAQKVMVYLRGLLDEEWNRIEQMKEAESCVNDTF